MDVGEQDVARIPAENLRVARPEFAAVWRAAEAHRDGPVGDMYDLGVVAVCRWLARSPVPAFPGQRSFTTPVTGGVGIALPELIEPEAVAAEVLAFADPRPLWVTDRFDWIDAVHATFVWARRGCGACPWPPPAPEDLPAAYPHLRA